MIRRVALLAALALVVAAPAAAAGPTLGGRVATAHLPIRWELDAHAFTITNLSTIPAAVTVDAGSGWAVDADAFTLAVDQSREVTITTAGPDPVTIRATLTAVEAPPGMDRGSVTLQAFARHATWIEAHGSTLLAVALVLLALVGFLAVFLTRRRWAR